MTEWKTIPIKIKKEEARIFDLIATNYKISRNKLIKNILGTYLQGEIQTSVLRYLKIEEIVPSKFIEEYNALLKQNEEFEGKLTNYYTKPDNKKILRKKWKEIPRETRENIKQAGTTVRSLTRQRRMKVGRPKKSRKNKPGRPKN